MLKIGTRGSQLALYQANAVAALMRERGQTDTEVVVIRTSGDRLADAKLSEIGGKGLFVKEIEEALLDGTVDIAVHSSKDMPAVLPDGLDLGAVLPREDPRDAIVLPTPSGEVILMESAKSMGDVVQCLGAAPTIGTSSVRRIAQLMAVFPRARFLPIRGNLDTRLRKLDAQEAVTPQFDAIVLAAAGLRRLGYAARISATLPPDTCVPAPGQGIIAVEIRKDDRLAREAVSRLNDPDVRAALDAERAVVRRLGGGCQMPIGAYATSSNGILHLSAIVISLDGSRAVRAEALASAEGADQLGIDVAERLLTQGASEILAHASPAQASTGSAQP